MVEIEGYIELPSGMLLPYERKTGRTVRVWPTSSVHDSRHAYLVWANDGRTRRQVLLFNLAIHESAVRMAEWAQRHGLVESFEEVQDQDFIIVEINQIIRYEQSE